MKNLVGVQRYDHIRTVGLKLVHGSKLPGSVLNTDNLFGDSGVRPDNLANRFQELVLRLIISQRV